MTTENQSELTQRRKLHHAIRNEFATRIAKHYRDNPDEFKNIERVQAFTVLLLGLMEHLLHLVDCYYPDPIVDECPADAHPGDSCLPSTQPKT